MHVLGSAVRTTLVNFGENHDYIIMPLTGSEGGGSNSGNCSAAKNSD